MIRRFPRGNAPPGPRPRVLLVDDHRLVLDTVSGILAGDFDVAGIASDGRRALDLARELDPEVIVLDVTMPGLDGFETARALRQAGSRAPIVFLSMHASDEFVGEAFRSGGRGYVVKSRLKRDLPTAIEQALLGRVFVPSLTSLFHLVESGGHAMQVHDGEEPLVEGLATMFDLALRRGDATCVIANEPVREGLAARLRTLGWNVGGASGHKRYLAIDAAEALNRFMRDGLPDAKRLAEIAVELDQYRLAAAEGAASRLTIFGTMVAALSAASNHRAVIALETLWNTLTRELPFFTVCGYTTSCFHDGDPHDLWSNVRTEHWALSHAADA